MIIYATILYIYSIYRADYSSKSGSINYYHPRIAPMRHKVLPHASECAEHQRAPNRILIKIINLSFNSNKARANHMPYVCAICHMMLCYAYVGTFAPTTHMNFFFNFISARLQARKFYALRVAARVLHVYPASPQISDECVGSAESALIEYRNRGSDPRLFG